MQNYRQNYTVACFIFNFQTSNEKTIGSKPNGLINIADCVSYNRMIIILFIYEYFG
jgi:hypothetical protein